MKFFLVFLLFCHAYSMEKTHYAFTTEPIDVIISCDEKDSPYLNLCINAVRENGENLGRIFVISKEPYTHQAEWIDASIFPFTQDDVNRQASYMTNISKLLNTNSLGRFYQQLIKLYAPLIIPGISPNVLVLDANVIFLNPVSYLREDGAGYYSSNESVSVKCHDHMKKLIPGLIPCSCKCGTVNHMLFQRPVIEDLFQIVETSHQKPFWIAYCDCIDMFLCLPSEYEMYFHFLFNRSNQPAIRSLKWKKVTQFHTLSEYKEKGYHYICLLSKTLNDWKTITD